MMRSAIPKWVSVSVRDAAEMWILAVEASGEVLNQRQWNNEKSYQIWYYESSYLIHHIIRRII